MNLSPHISLPAHISNKLVFTKITENGHIIQFSILASCGVPVPFPAGSMLKSRPNIHPHLTSQFNIANQDKMTQYWKSIFACCCCCCQQETVRGAVPSSTPYGPHCSRILLLWHRWMWLALAVASSKNTRLLLARGPAYTNWTISMFSTSHP